MSPLYLLFENAAGLALFLRKDAEATAQTDDAVQEAVLDAKRFAEIIQLHVWRPFKDSEEALELARGVANATPTESLINFLERHLPKAKTTYQLGVYDPELGKMLEDKFSIAPGQTVRELLRGCRMHFSKLCKEASALDLDKARHGLGHSYSRSRMQLDPNRQDSPIVNTIAMIDGLDENIKTFATRVRQWYTLHFPELENIVSDNIVYVKVARTIRVRDSWKASREAELTEVCGSKQIQAEICKALRMTRGQEIAERDMQHIDYFAGEVVKFAQMRKTLHDYLKAKMDVVAPNLTALIGEIIGARLISRAGSLVKLAKYPPVTVQLLGAEQALFRALKEKQGRLPKHGLIAASEFVSRAQKKDRGAIARVLGKKCSLASRIDCFSDKSNSVYGEKFKEQVEDRLAALAKGAEPSEKVEVPEVLPQATEATNNLQAEERNTSVTETEPRKGVEALPGAVAEVKKGRKKLKKKRTAAEPDAEGVTAEDDAGGRGDAEGQRPPPRLKKKRKKAEPEQSEGAPRKKKRKAAEVREEPQEAPKKRKGLRKLAKTKV